MKVVLQNKNLKDTTIFNVDSVEILNIAISNELKKTRWYVDDCEIFLDGEEKSTIDLWDFYPLIKKSEEFKYKEALIIFKLKELENEFGDK